MICILIVTHYFRLKFSKTLEKCVCHLDLAKFYSAPRLAWEAAIKKTEVKLDLITDIDMLLMIGKDIRGGICHAIHLHAKANKNYMNDYDKNKESSYLKYWHVNNL